MYFRLNRSLFRILLWFLRVGFMRFDGYGFLAEIFGGVGFWVLIGNLLGFVRMVVAKILEWILMRFG